MNLQRTLGKQIQIRYEIDDKVKKEKFQTHRRQIESLNMNYE